MEKLFTVSGHKTKEGRKGPFAGFLNFTILSFLTLGFLLVTSQAAKAQCQTAIQTADLSGNLPFAASKHWLNSSNISNSDNQTARVNLEDAQFSSFLFATDFDLAIPANSTILGIEVFIEKHEEAYGGFKDAFVRLMVGGSIEGINQAAFGEWPSTDAIQTYGNSSDTWGASLSAADLNSIGFGVVISVTKTGDLQTMSAYVDKVSMVVYYNNPNGPCSAPISSESFNTSQLSKEKNHLNHSFEKVNGVETDPKETISMEEALASNSTEEIPATAVAPLVIINSNPATSEVKLTMKQTTLSADYFLQTPGGAMVLKGTMAPGDGVEKTLDLSSFRPGIYFISVVQGDFRFTKKFIL